jgi:hypothetical protein
MVSGLPGKYRKNRPGLYKIGIWEDKPNIRIPPLPRAQTCNCAESTQNRAVLGYNRAAGFLPKNGITACNKKSQPVTSRSVYAMWWSSPQ